MKIGQLFEKPIDRPIEEVIKVDQANEKVVLNEIDEYVATDSIKSQFAMVYREIADGPAKPREGIGVWISGFFGSGKSSFAKILGYTVANRKVGETTASELFKRSCGDERLSALLDSINTRIPFQAVIFDVSMDRGVRTASDRLTEIMYRALLRELGYAEDFDLAELEIVLEADGKLDDFENKFEQLHGDAWKKRRQMGLAINEASAVLHKIDPKIYPSADSYAVTVGKGRADVDPNKLARRAFELSARRASKKALIFVIDEVGQYVSRSVDKMLDLQAIVQALGVEGRNRTEKRETVSPFWIIVTSQEKLNEVVTALDSKKIELARLQDRFRIPVDLKQADISEVTARRVLSKKSSVNETIGKLYDENSGRISECCTLERSARNIEITRSSFINLYPYLPYQIDLCIDIVAGLRLKRGAHRHVGGSNRTIIKQAQEMMINDRTKLADADVKTLVTLDKVYELLYVGNLLPTEVTREVDDVAKRLSNNPMALKVAKAIALLESVKDLPRTPNNIAVVLHPSVDSKPLRKEVEEALKELERAQFVRNTEEGFKLLTVQEKTWETKRTGIEPREADRNRIHRELISEIFSEPKTRAYRYKELRTFSVSITANGETVQSDGDIPLNFLLADPEEMKETLEGARNNSASNDKEIYWVFQISDEIRNLGTELFRSREMVSEYERLGAQQKLTGEESSCLADEKNRRDQFHRNLRGKLVKAIEGGVVFFRGVRNEASALGTQLSATLNKLLDNAVPVLYPKLAIGTLALSGGECEKLLTAANLSGLPKVFYNDKPELSLVIKQGGHFVPNLGCDLCREILDYLRREHNYGNKVSGKMLELFFKGFGYGWDIDSLRLGLAILFRGGSVEVTHQGRKYHQYIEPSARTPFMTTPAFRAASFAPREALDLKVLANAARMYEEITGNDVNIEESEIANAFKQVAASDRERLLPLAARLDALRLPGASDVTEQLNWVEGILEMPPDDCVKTLAFEGKSYLEKRTLTDRIEKAATDENVETVRTARRILDEQWPTIETISNDELKQLAQELQSVIESGDCLYRIEKVKGLSEQIGNEYRQVYTAAFEKRRKAYESALEAIKGRPEWLAASETENISDDQRDALLKPLSEKAESQLDLPPGATVCRRTHATLAQLTSDTAAVEAVASDVLSRLLALVAPDDKIERVRIAKYYPSRITSERELDEFLSDLKERLSKILASKATIILE